MQKKCGVFPTFKSFNLQDSSSYSPHSKLPERLPITEAADKYIHEYDTIQALLVSEP